MDLPFYFDVLQSMRLYPQPPVLIRRSLENDILGPYPIKRLQLTTLWVSFASTYWQLASVQDSRMQLLSSDMRFVFGKLTEERIFSSRFGIYIEVLFIGMTRKNSIQRDGLWMDQTQMRQTKISSKKPFFSFFIHVSFHCDI